MMIQSHPYVSFTKKLSIPVLLVFVAISFSGCDLAENQLKTDRANNMEFQDYRDGLSSRIPEDTESASVDGSIPELQSYVAPVSDNLKAMPLVSISVNQTVPVRDVLFELAEQANYDIELDPRIRGSIIFTARNRPFDLVVNRIAEIAGLRATFNDDVLRVELDDPYNKTYKIEYLSYIRTNSGSITSSVNVVSGEGADTGSTFSASTSSESDFWGELESNMTQILGVAESEGNLRTNNDPEITAVDRNPAPVEPVIAQGPDGSPIVQPVTPELTVNPLPVSTGDEEEDEPVISSFSVNRQAGLVSVFGTDRQHRQIQEYLTVLRRAMTSQVLIEAKVLEVELSDEYSAGIDWSANVGKSSFGFDLVTTGGLNPPFLENAALEPNAAGFFSFLSGDFTTGIQALSRFGTVSALASPRLTVLNNQSAVLNVATNQVYFEIEIEQSTDEGVTDTEVDTEIRNVPEGVLINVQPSIDLDRRTISMAVRPTITTIVDFEPDPGAAFVAAIAGVDITSDIPNVNVQEIDSVLRMRDGQAIVMGGLMQDSVRSEETGVPVLSEVPVVGSLFKTHVDEVQKTELVIFLKATILDDFDNIHQTDKDLYRQFSGDRRPMKF